MTIESVMQNRTEPHVPLLVASSAASESAFAALVDDLITRLRAGENLDPDRIATDHPEFSSRLKEILPGLRAVCDLTGRSCTAPDAPGDHNDLLAGVLGDFQILREIGRGGMGIVYEAIQTSLNRRVALKVLPFAAMLDPRHLQRFKNEALAAASLDHPNIVEVHGVGCERGVHFYAMRYVEGQTLAEVIEGMRAERRETRENTKAESRKPKAEESSNPPTAAPSACAAFRSPLSALNETAPIAQAPTLASRPSSLDPSSRDFFRTIAELGIQAAEALDHAHQMGIVHRDIKPSNLMIEVGARGERREASQRRDDDRVKSVNSASSPLASRPSPPKLYITDFGLAHIESDATLTLTGDLLGTLRYMSPEQAEGRSAILDHRTDIYSLGITLYELLTLQPAFPATDRQTLLTQISQEEPPAPRKLNKHIPADLETIILKSISKDPHDRYGTAADLAADLARFAEQKPIAARHPTMAQRVSRWARRHTALLGAALITLSLIAASGIAATILVARAYESEADQRSHAEENLRLANANLQIAADAVESMMVRLVSDPNYVKGNAHAIERLISDAMEFQDRLLPQSNDPKLLRTVALSCRRAIWIRLLAGTPDKAESAARRASEVFEVILNADPESVENLQTLGNNELELGRILWATDQYSAAETPWLRSLSIYENLFQRFADDPLYQVRLADTLVYLARWQVHFGRIDEAKRLLKRSAEVGANLPENNQGVYEAFEAHRWRGALYQCQAEIASSKRDFEHANDLLNKAIEFQWQALEIAPDDPWAKDFCEKHRRARAAALIRAGQIDAAVQAIEDMVSEFGAFQSAHHHGAELLLLCVDRVTDPERRDRYRSRARELVAKADTVHCRSTVSEDHLAWFLLTCADETFREPQRALNLAKIVTRTVPERLSAWRTLSLAHYRLGQWDAAETALQRVIVGATEDSPDAAPLFLLAMIQWQQGEREAARQTYERAANHHTREHSSDSDVAALSVEAAALFKQ